MNLPEIILDILISITILGAFGLIGHLIWERAKLLMRIKDQKARIGILDADLIDCRKEAKELYDSLKYTNVIVQGLEAKIALIQEAPKANLLEALDILNKSLIIIMNINAFCEDSEAGKVLGKNMLTLLQNTEKTIAKLNRTLVDMRGGEANVQPTTTEMPKIIPAKPNAPGME